MQYRATLLAKLERYLYPTPAVCGLATTVDIPTEIPQQEIPEDEGVEQETPENNQSKINLVYVCPKKGLYGIYLNEKDELYLKENKSA